VVAGPQCVAALPPFTPRTAHLMNRTSRYTTATNATTAAAPTEMTTTAVGASSRVDKPNSRSHVDGEQVDALAWQTAYRGRSSAGSSCG
jgi:hypothetical protein